jgi:hypothetical protein
MLPSINMKVGPTQPGQMSKSSYDQADTTTPILPADLDTFGPIQVAVEEVDRLALSESEQ